MLGAQLAQAAVLGGELPGKPAALPLLEQVKGSGKSGLIAEPRTDRALKSCDRQRLNHPADCAPLSRFLAGVLHRELSRVDRGPGRVVFLG